MDMLCASRILYLVPRVIVVDFPYCIGNLFRKLQSSDSFASAIYVRFQACFCLIHGQYCHPRIGQQGSVSDKREIVNKPYK